MIDILWPPETTDLPPPPSGWHVVTYAVLASGDLAILGSEFDLRTYLTAKRDAANRQDE